MSTATALGQQRPTHGSVALSARDLRIEVTRTGADIVDEVSFDLLAGEVLGVVGESGSGKTTVGLALLAHTRRGARITHGTVVVDGRDLLALGEEDRRQVRGRVVAYVPQDPASSLNPALRIGTQLMEVLQAHGFGAGDDERRDRLAETMREVLLPDGADFLRRYPHQLSGGQQQRVGLAMAFACRPRVIVLDEPTTGLDVSTQAHVLATVRELNQAHGAAALYVSHDLAVVGTLADRVAVMYAGRITELGPAQSLFTDAGHPYTRRLVAAIPDLRGRRELLGIPGRAPSPGARPPGCAFAPRCRLAVDACSAEIPPLVEVGREHVARCIRVDAAREIPLPRGATVSDEVIQADTPILEVRDLSVSYGPIQVVHGASLQLAAQECLAVVGESGSGKTTLARTIAGLHGERTGAILLAGRELEPSARARSREARRRVQYIFQNPYGSLNPRRTVGESVGRPLAMVEGGTKNPQEQIAVMLERVSLTAAYAERYPDQLSGGERQRVAIARALICRPDVLVCDEVTSALDVSVQAAIIQLLAELQRDLGLSMLFVTHNLPLVRSIAHRVAVMQYGRLVETGPVGTVLDHPREDYTRALLADTPTLGAAPA